MATAKKRKLTVYLDPEVARAAKVSAARTERRDSEVVEDALRAHLGLKALDDAQGLSTISEDEALESAYRELEAARKSQQ